MMAIGERIHFFRILRGMTQKYLGTIVGFPERSADVRLAQYETGTRKPKAELTAALAQALDVSPHALDVPDIDSYIGLMHTLFTLEDYRYILPRRPPLSLHRLPRSVRCSCCKSPEFYKHIPWSVYSSSPPSGFMFV